MNQVPWVSFIALLCIYWHDFKKVLDDPSSSLLSIAQCPEGSYHEVYYSLVLLFISFCPFPSPSFFFFGYFSLKEFSSSLTCVVYFCQFVIISVVLYFQLLETNARFGLVKFSPLPPQRIIQLIMKPSSKSFCLTRNDRQTSNAWSPPSSLSFFT